MALDFVREGQALHSLRLSFQGDPVVCTSLFPGFYSLVREGCRALRIYFLWPKGGCEIQKRREQSWEAPDLIPGVRDEGEHTMRLPLRCFLVDRD